MSLVRQGFKHGTPPKKIHGGEKTVSSTNVAGKTEYPHLEN
jgi:hypothetical protein